MDDIPYNQVVKGDQQIKKYLLSFINPNDNLSFAETTQTFVFFTYMKG